MNSQDIFDGVTDIRDDLIQGAKEAPKKRKRWGKRHWMGVVAALLAVAIIGGVLLRSGDGLTAYAIAEAKYPKMAPYPDMSAGYSEAKYEAWWNDVIAQRRDLGDISSLQSFFVRSERRSGRKPGLVPTECLHGTSHDSADHGRGEPGADPWAFGQRQHGRAAKTGQRCVELQLP